MLSNSLPCFFSGEASSLLILIFLCKDMFSRPQDIFARLFEHFILSESFLTCGYENCTWYSCDGFTYAINRTNITFLLPLLILPA